MQGCEKKPKINYTERLIDACRNGHLEGVNNILLVNEVDINATSDFEWTPLLAATEGWHLDIVNCLLQVAGIDVNSANGNGWTPLHEAIFHGQLRIVNRLFRVSGIDVNAKTNSGKTPLHMACEDGYSTIVLDLLLFDEMNIDIKDHVGATPLHAASLSNRLIIAKMLISHGALVDIKERNLRKTKCGITICANWKQWLPMWSPKTHKYFPVNLKDIIKQWNLICGRKGVIVKVKIPKDIRVLMISYIVEAWRNSKEI